MLCEYIFHIRRLAQELLQARVSTSFFFFTEDRDKMPPSLIIERGCGTIQGCLGYVVSISCHFLQLIYPPPLDLNIIF